MYWLMIFAYSLAQYFWSYKTNKTYISSNNLSNNSLVAAQENSSHCENQLELALIDEPYVEGQSTDSGSTAKSTQAGSDNTIQ